MNGKELKQIRIYSGLNQTEFAKILEVKVYEITNMETGKIEVPPILEEKLEKIIDKEYNTTLTNKVFSRELFLKDMLTGNEVIDDIYINADWLKEFDNKLVHAKGTRLIIRNFKNNELRVTKADLQYVIIHTNPIFFCKKEWLK